MTTGHFALEDKADEMVPLICDFLNRNVNGQQSADRVRFARPLGQMSTRKAVGGRTRVLIFELLPKE
jgi:hypothetical protein